MQKNVYQNSEDASLRLPNHEPNVSRKPLFFFTLWLGLSHVSFNDDNVGEIEILQTDGTHGCTYT